MPSQLISKIQMAMRARQYAIGDQLLRAIQSRQAKLVLFSSACGGNRQKKLKDKCAYYQVPIFEIDAEQFEQISQKPMMSLAILDDNFAKGIVKDMKG